MRQKLKRFAANERLRPIVQPGKPFYDRAKGRWNADFFGAERPITVEIACGKGEYSVGLARLHPDRHFVGVDKKGDRLFIGATEVDEEGIGTVAFLRADIRRLEDFFAEDEVSELWMTFPDPRPKEGDERRRLTYPPRLEVYRRLLKPGARFHLRTDSAPFVAYTEEALAEIGVTEVEIDRAAPVLVGHDGEPITSAFERRFRAEGKPIHHLTCVLGA
jgi:tRNA (guanine-N7-)-methyltransferase